MAVGKLRGFTLIELMIAVAVVGILVAIAVPSYSSYVRKGNRAAAQAFLLNVAQRQQQFLSDNRAYAGDLPTLFGTSSGTNPMPSDVAKSYAEVAMETRSGPPYFKYTMQPVGSQAQGGEQSLWIDSTGSKSW